MADRENATATDEGRQVHRAAPVRGVVHRSADAAVYDLGRAEPEPVLEPFVEHLWWVRWDLPGDSEREVTTIPFPAVHLTVENGEAGEVRHGHPMPAVLVHGVPTRAFTVRLQGAGWALGVKFRPGGWAAWSGLDAARLTDRVVAASAVDRRWCDAGADVLTAGGHEERIRLLSSRLAEFAVEPNGEYLQVRTLVEQMAADPSVRLLDVASSVGWSPRTLQRRFRRLVGVSPKWVLMRYRLQEAALELERHPGADLADVAARHGWYDQSHLTADFRRVLDTTPSRYVHRARTAGARTSPRP